MRLLLLLVFSIYCNCLFSQQFKQVAANPFGINTEPHLEYNSMHFVDIDQDEDFDIIFEDPEDSDSKILLNQGSKGNPDFNNYAAQDFLVFDDGTYIGEGMFGVEISSTFLDIDLDGDIDNLSTIGSNDPSLPAEFLCNINLDELITAGNGIFGFENADRPGSEYGLPVLSLDAVQLITAVDLDGDSDLDIFSMRLGEYTYELDFLYYESLYSEGTQVFSGEEIRNPFGLSSSDPSNFGIPNFIDIDNDGDKDLLTVNFEGNWLYYKNYGSPEFANFLDSPDINPFNLSPLPGFGFPTVLDVNNDGRDDIMVGYEGDVYYYEFDLQSSNNNQLNSDTSLEIFPNPSNGFAEIKTNYDSFSSVTIRSVLGNEIQKLSFNSLQNVELNLSHLDNGSYFIEFQLRNNEVITKQLIIAR